MEVYFVAYTCGKQGAFVGIDNEVNRYVCYRILKFQNIVQHYVQYRFLSSFIGTEVPQNSPMIPCSSIISASSAFPDLPILQCEIRICFGQPS
jgi:hypothetical protein